MNQVNNQEIVLLHVVIQDLAERLAIELDCEPIAAKTMSLAFSKEKISRMTQDELDRLAKDMTHQFRRALN